MESYNHGKNISNVFEIEQRLIFFKSPAYSCESNSYYENDETDIFIFVNWKIFNVDCINDKDTLNEFINKNNLDKITDTDFSDRLKLLYKSKLDKSVVDFLEKDKSNKVYNGSKILEEVTNQYKYLYLYIYYFDKFIIELREIILELYKKKVLIEYNQHIKVIFDKNSYLYFGEIDRTSLKMTTKYTKNSSTLKTLIISSQPEKIYVQNQNILNFKQIQPHNFIELIEKSNSKLGINKAYVLLIDLQQLVEKISEKLDTIFSDNVRLYVNNSFVDNAIIKTLLDNSEAFQVFHNGISIICKNAKIGLNGILIEDSNIVNGAQTIFNLIKLIKLGIIDLNFLENKFVLAKVIEVEETTKNTRLLITQAANTQKAINIQDLKSNHEYLIRYKSLLSNYAVDLLIKRGTQSKFRKSIKVEKFAKIIYSSFYQLPGKARNSSSYIFFDDRQNIFDIVFEYRDSNEFNNLRILIYLIFDLYESYRDKIDISLANASKYAELYYVSFVFGNIIVNEDLAIFEQMKEKIINRELIYKLVQKYSLIFCDKLKNSKVTTESNLFEVFRNEDLYKEISVDIKDLKVNLRKKYLIEL